MLPPAAALLMQPLFMALQTTASQPKAQAVLDPTALRGNVRLSAHASALPKDP